MKFILKLDNLGQVNQGLREIRNFIALPENERLQQFLYQLKFPAKIPRLGGEDKSGVLYIGQTNNISRIKFLVNSFISPPKDGTLYRHGAEQLYWQCLHIQERYSVAKMWVEVIPCEHSKKLEFECLIEYSLEYGEVPPFNGAIPRK